ncbi:methyltransferase domain-containing protein [Candidatus Bathyarchaeota archaeon]|nr:methyltransferase domain-containing protein [Candidatus Bathyarchaeota archaeon]
MSDDMVKYYRDRAREYEKIYEWRDPCRQEEQDLMEKELKEAFRGRNVLDIGCGTGYWTERISQTAKSIIGIDINEAVLDIARSKNYSCPTEFRIMDAYDMSFNSEDFTGALATFWLSHVRWKDIPGWLEHLHDQLDIGSRVFIADNVFIEGIGGELVRKEADRNTYKLRTLRDGSEHLIVKNYFTENELLELFEKYCLGLSTENIFHGRCFWWINYIYH